jgi:hypothetical protein
MLTTSIRRASHTNTHHIGNNKAYVLRTSIYNILSSDTDIHYIVRIFYFHRIFISKFIGTSQAFPVHTISFKIYFNITDLETRG